MKSSSIQKVGATHRKNIVNFFLNLYKLQLGAVDPDSTQGEFTLIRRRAPGGDHAYELKVEIGGKWQTRRMTIGPAGESSGSRSFCYRVIYDDLLIVKIPPRPIVDIGRYIESLHFERRIAETLSPAIECSVPNVSAILNKIPKYRDNKGLAPEEQENRFIHWLKQTPRLQNHLKIGDSFAFFMALSKNLFLNSVAAGIHDIELEMQNETLGNCDPLWDIAFFEDKYGSDNEDVFFGIHDVFSEYDRQVLPFIEQYLEASSVPVHTRKEWFLNYLAQKDTGAKGAGLADDFGEELNGLIAGIFEEKREQIRAYQSVVKRHVHRKNHHRNIGAFQGLITNLLKLLFKLKISGVALRDLKPENIYLATAGEPAPKSLSAAGSYSLGLIDLETAVVIHPPGNRGIAQPLLGGTPLFAVPAHLFPNELLGICYGDLGRMFHLQDWHAVVGLIFQVVTGKRLFEKTSRQLPAIMQLLKTTHEQKPDLDSLFRQCNRTFWRHAQKEFVQQTNAYDGMLASVKPSITRDAARMLQKEMNSLQKDIAEAVHKKIDAQRLFRSSKSHRALRNAPADRLVQCRTNWEAGVNVPNAPQKIKKQIIALLDDLVKLKYAGKGAERHAREVEGFPLKISALNLLQLMFFAVSSFMSIEGGEPSADIGFETSFDTEPVTRAETDVYETTLFAD